MFQYATLYSLGKKLDKEIGVPFKNRSSDDKLDFCLADVFTLSAKDCQGHFASSVYSEPSFNYDPNILNVPDNCDIRGYFQSEKYFKEHKKDLKEKEFKFLKTIDDKVNSLLEGNDSDLISIHVRLGDYLQLEDCHPVCSIDYYKKALEMVPRDANVVLFSDDYGRALRMFKDIGINVMMTGTNYKFIDMCMMTKCNYHIIANSSFSWWGAWLSNSKKIIAPKTWFGAAHHMPKNWNDIYCEEWIIL